jgi:hypothetical protein
VATDADRNLVDESEEELLNRLRRELVEHLPGINGSAAARSLRLYEVWRQVSLRRIVDLAEAALSLFHEERVVPACTLTRSVVETVAVQYYLYKKIVSHTGSRDPDSIHKLLMSAVFGRRDKEWPQQPIQVLTAIDHLNKQFPGFRGEYDRLCEYAHPNLGGGYGTYVRSEGSEMQSHFGSNPNGLKMGPWGQVELQMALVVATVMDNELRMHYPRLSAMIDQNA